MKRTLGFIALASAGAAAFLLAMLRATGGRLSMPLDDAFIFFQYARRVTEGAPFTYQEGGPVTTGATSFLTVAVDAIGYGVGFRGEAMVVFALLVGVGSLAWSAHSAWVLGTRLTPKLPWLPPALLFTSGPILWATYSGMDFPLFSALALAMAARWPREGERPSVALFVYGALLGLARPDAVFLIVGAFAVAVLRPARLAYWALPLGGAILPFAVQAILTGSPQSASMDVKSVLGKPDFSLEQWFLQAVSHLLFVIKGVFGGSALGDPMRLAANDRSGAGLYLVPFALGLAGVGLVPGAWHEFRTRRGGLHLLLTLWIALLVLAQAFTVPTHWHWNRYLITVYALAIPGIAAGIYRVGRVVDLLWPELPKGESRRSVALALIALSLPGVVFFWVAYGANCADIRFQHIELAEKLNAGNRINAKTVVAVHDVGALAYFGQYRVLDIEGLASPRFRKASRLGSAGVWEALESMPPGERPEYLAVYAAWYDPAFLGMHELLFAQRQFRPTIAAGNPLQVYAADWSLAGSGARPATGEFAGCRLLAEVDVADLESESAARYRYRILDGAYDSVFLRQELAGGATVADGGRIISGGEAFSIPSPKPGEDLTIVTRTHTGFRVRVRVDGGEAGVWSASGAGGSWVESVYRVEGVAPDGNRVEIELASDDPHHSAYGSFHYWVYACP